jgi:hypothetical protein
MSGSSLLVVDFKVSGMHGDNTFISLSDHIKFAEVHLGSSNMGRSYSWAKTKKRSNNQHLNYVFVH